MEHVAKYEKIPQRKVVVEGKVKEYTERVEMLEQHLANDGLCSLLHRLKLDQYHGQIKDEGYAYLGDLLGADDAEVDELAESVGMRKPELRRLKPELRRLKQKQATAAAAPILSPIPVSPQPAGA